MPTRRPGLPVRLEERKGRGSPELIPAAGSLPGNPPHREHPPGTQKTPVPCARRGLPAGRRKNQTVELPCWLGLKIPEIGSYYQKDLTGLHARVTVYLALSKTCQVSYLTPHHPI